MAGMAGESLLLVRTQVGHFEAIMRDDFRVLMFLKNDPTEAQVKVLADKILGLSDVAAVRFMSRDESLAELRQEDPELVDSVTWVGENPLAAAFEVRPSAAGLARFAEWLSGLRKLEEGADLRYRPGQVRAILQAQLFGHFLGLVLNALLCGVAVLLGVCLWRAPHRPAEAKSAAGGKQAGLLLGAAFAGAAAGMAVAVAAAWPTRHYLPWWDLPLAAHQLLLWVSASFLSGVLIPWTVAE
jgi:hypothetical protein